MADNPETQLNMPQKTQFTRFEDAFNGPEAEQATDKSNTNVLNLNRQKT